MKNSDRAPSPKSPNDSDPIWASARTGGITRREHFAGLAMQGFCSNVNANPTTKEHFDNLACDSVSMADALLAELEK